MFCNNCGKENPEEANFCRNCGNSLRKKNSSIIEVNDFAKKLIGIQYFDDWYKIVSCKLNSSINWEMKVKLRELARNLLYFHIIGGDLSYYNIINISDSYLSSIVNSYWSFTNLPKNHQTSFIETNQLLISILELGREDCSLLKENNEAAKDPSNCLIYDSKDWILCAKIWRKHLMRFKEADEEYDWSDYTNELKLAEKESIFCMRNAQINLSENPIEWVGLAIIWMVEFEEIEEAMKCFREADKLCKLEDEKSRIEKVKAILRKNFKNF